MHPQLPHPPHRNWHVVDEGGSKGVPKLGLLSRRVGDTLELKLWPEAGCRVVKAQLGYLVSATRAALAGIELTCLGCECYAPPTPYPKLYPFPSFQTFAPFADDTSYWVHNVSVTAYTGFIAIMTSSETRCTLRVRHIAQDGGRRVRQLFNRDPTPAFVAAKVAAASSNASEIRIDSFTVESLDTRGFTWLQQKSDGQVVAVGTEPKSYLSGWQDNDAGQIAHWIRFARPRVLHRALQTFNRSRCCNGCLALSTRPASRGNSTQARGGKRSKARS